MAIHLLTGPAGSGKTHACLEAMAARVAAGDGLRLILLVPEQATFQTERMAIQRLGPSPRVQVASFQRLAWRVFQEVGGAARPPITEIGRQMVLRAILQRQRDKLVFFGRVADRPGLVEHLSRSLHELSAFGHGAPELRAAVERLDRPRDAMLRGKLQDLALVVEGLKEHLEGRFSDPDKTLARLAERLGASRSLAGALVWVDGFSGFTPQEYGVLAGLAGICQELVVTLCLDSRDLGDPEETRLFHPTHDTARRLADLAADLGVPFGSGLVPLGPEGASVGSEEVPIGSPSNRGKVPARFAQAPDIAHLEREFFATPGVRFETEAHCVRLVRAPDRRTEVEAAAREIARLCREDGFRYKDIAVVVRSLDDYHALISASFGECGIPHFIDRRRPMAHHPLLELVRGAIGVLATNWQDEAVMRFLKSDLVPIERHRVDRLENVILARGIRGAKAWRAPWLESDGQTGRLEAIKEQATRALFAFQDAAGGKRPVALHCTALFKLLEDLGVPATLLRWAEEAETAGDLDRAGEHLQVYDGLLDLLDQTVGALGEWRMSPSEFLPVVEAGLAGLTLGLIPPRLDQVVVGSIERSRLAKVRAALVLGATEGAFPQSTQEDVVFDDVERLLLASRGLALGPTSRERLFQEPFLMYQALTRASARLTISHPLADDRGRGLAPSPLWTRVAYLLPHCRMELAEAGAHDDPEHALTLPQLADRLVRRLAPARSGATPGDDWLDLYQWVIGDPARREAAAPILGGLAYRNTAASLPVDIMTRLVGDTPRLSASRLETLAACRFKYFSEHLLRLRPRAQFRIEPIDVGHYMHAGLERFVRGLSEAGTDLAEADEGIMAAHLELALDGLAEPALADRFMRTGQARQLARQLRVALGHATRALGRQARRGIFRPIALEVAFGKLDHFPPGGEVVLGKSDQLPPGEIPSEALVLPALTIELSGGRYLEVRGRIDRLDAATGPDGACYILVTDYKLSPKGLDRRRIAWGLDLQLGLYLLVATRHAAELMPGAAAERFLPAGALYFPIQPGIKTVDGPPAAEDAVRDLYKRYKTSGILVDDFDIARMLDSDGMNFSEAYQLFFTTDGKLGKQSNVASAGGLDRLGEHVMAQAVALGEALLAGRIDIAPYKVAADSPCNWCEQQAVCRFDTQQPDNRFRYLSGEPADPLGVRADPVGARADA